MRVQIDNTITDEKSAADNSGLAKCGVKCLIEHLCIFHTFVHSESVVLLSPALRQAVKR